MPNFIVPRRVTPHRVAAIALYRALLSQSRNLPNVPQDQRDALQNIIRNRFKQSLHLHSYRRLKVSFEAGYEAIDYLDAAVEGNGGSKRYILDLLERSPARVKEPKPKNKLPRKNRTASDVSELDKQSTIEQPKPSIFDRPIPLEQLSGKRHVPVLFNANQIPVLRLKKPQPESLSRFIRQRIDQRQIWHDRRHRLYEELYIAKFEDKWDSITGQRTSTIEHAMEPLWRDAVDEASEAVQASIDAESAKYQVMATKMQAVVDREQALYDRERSERADGKRQMNHARDEEPKVNYKPDQAVIG